MMFSILLWLPRLKGQLGTVTVSGEVGAKMNSKLHGSPGREAQARIKKIDSGLSFLPDDLCNLEYTFSKQLCSVWCTRDNSYALYGVLGTYDFES